MAEGISPRDALVGEVGPETREAREQLYPQCLRAFLDDLEHRPSIAGLERFSGESKKLAGMDANSGERKLIANLICEMCPVECTVSVDEWGDGEVELSRNNVSFADCPTIE